MPPTTTKTLSPAELAKLEHAFATDPASEAYRPLAEAYLGMGRFMEAMVVCKKGVKAHPAKPDPRVLLARVYAEQGKDKKALEELAGAIGVAPNDKLVLRMTGALQIKTGEADAGKTNLLKALEIDPADEDTRAIFVQYKVELPKPPAPVAPPPTLVPAPTNGAAAAQRGANGTSGPQQQVTSAAPRAAARPSAPGQPKPAGQAVRRTQPARVQEENPSELNEISELSEMGDRPRRRKGGGGAVVTLVLFLLVVVGLSAYYGIGQYVARQKQQVNAKLVQAQDALKGDSYDSYQKASKIAEEALEINPDSDKAHAFAAYAYAVRWGDHGGDESTHQRSEEHLAQAVKLAGKEPISQVLATQALLKYYSGKGTEAIKGLKPIVDEYKEKGQRPSLLLLTLGLIQMNQGDLEGARDNLEAAQQAASDDPRVYSALGTLARRRGNDGEALKHFSTALKYTRDSHPEALIGTSLLILDQANPAGGYPNAAKYLKRVLESQPPPSPRQLAMAHMVQAFLVSRVSRDIPLYTNKEFQAELQKATGISPDPAKAKAEILKEEDMAMQDKSNPELFLIRGKRLLYEENYAGAAAEIRTALAMNSQRAHYHVELAKVLMRKEGGEKEAEEALRKALILVPDSPKLTTLLAQALYKQKKLDDAITQYEKAIKDPKSKNAEARYALGRIYRDDKKDFGKSAEFFKRAAEEFYGDSLMVASAYDEQGLSLEAKGDKVGARTAYEAALNAEKEFEKGYCDFARFLQKLADPRDKDLTKTIAAEYLKLTPKGECAADMTKLAQ
jgi:Tfp pilus assembly protein PilF